MMVVKDDFSAFLKEKHVTVHGHSMPAHCNKKHTTRKNLVMCGNHAFEILPPTCCVPPKVPFPYKNALLRHAVRLGDR